tara:strand:+ start:21302 stop:22717 length:1416 start_codon:yes stop_codon:yes gene_type:complete
MALMCLFYQIPLAIFSYQVEVSLNNPWKYALSVNFGTLGLLVWGMLSHRLDTRGTTLSFPENMRTIYLTTGAVGLILILTYFQGVPWDCTGLYAIIYDPWMTLIAREFSVKLVGASAATYSIGANANAVAPLFILLSLWLARNCLFKRKIIGLLAFIICGFLAIVSVIISGTKGLLMPSLIMLVVGAYYWSPNWIIRISAISFSVFFMMGSIVSFEFLKDRGSEFGGSYDFASCSSRAGTCEKSQKLLNSLKGHNYSLGVPGYMIPKIETRLNCLCSGETEQSLCPEATFESGNGYKLDVGLDLPSRTIIGYVSSIFYRILVTPLQVSVWHYMYAETENVDGLKTLPLSKRIYGDSLNMPELVYQKYASVYFGGDRTSTGTSPTGFFLSYSAYVGWIGFLISLVLIIGLDSVFVFISKLLNQSLYPVLIGIVSIISMNFIVSDFLTVLISHGGAVGIFMVIIYIILKKKSV